VAIHKTIQDYRITFLSDSALSIVFTSMVYSGGAHENYRVTTYNFELQPVGELYLLTFFRGGCDYREILGLQSREALKRQTWERSLSSEQFANLFDRDEFGKQWLVDGTTIKDKVDFTFSDEGLTLYFPPYQVAPFAFGSWEVTLPYYDLREILRPNRLRQLSIPNQNPSPASG
jgi:hypothetical protein